MVTTANAATAPSAALATVPLANPNTSVQASGFPPHAHEIQTAVCTKTQTTAPATASRGSIRLARLAAGGGAAIRVSVTPATG